jgi:energy-coupling factor transporter ATP-binding protein EcfA2
MLTMIEKLEIEDCRIWKGRHGFEFGDGINVLHGDNGTGKSTLAMMLMLTMTHSANSGVLKNQLLPKPAGGSPKSSVTFTTDDGRYTISKVWGDRDQSKLIDTDSGDVLARGGDAEDKVRELAFEMPPANGNYSTNAGPMGNLARNAATHLPSLAFHVQGELHISLGMGEQLRRIGLTVDDAEMAKALLAVALGAESQRATYIQSLRANGTPRAKTDGSIVRKTAQLENLQEQQAKARELEAELNRAEADLYEQQARTEQDISEENQQRTREEIRTLRSQANAHRAARDLASEAAEQLRIVHEPLATVVRERKQLVEALETLHTQEKECASVASQSKKEYDAAEKAHQEATASSKECDGQLENAVAWNNHLTREQALLEDTASLKEAERQLEERRTHEAERLKLDKEFKAIELPTEKDWKAIRTLDEDIAIAKASRKMAIRVHKDSADLQVTGDGDLIEEDGEAAERIEVRKGKKLLVEIKQAMSGKSPSELEEEKKNLLEHLGAETTAQLHQRQIDYTALDTKIKTLEATLSALPQGDVLIRKIELHKARVESTVEEPKKPKPDGKLTEVLIRFEERQKIANEDKETKNAAKTERLVAYRSAEALHQAAAAAHLTKSTEVQDHRSAHGPDEEATQRESEAKAKLETAQTSDKAYREDMVLKEETPLGRAASLERNLDEYDTRRANILQLAERVKQLRNNEVLADLPTFEASIILLENELEGLRFEHDAYQHITRLATIEQTNAQAQSRNQISNEIDRLLRHVWGGDIEIRLDDEGKPIENQGLRVEDESHGSREQLQTILRMVLLGEASNHTGTTMLLDDALVFADQGRLSRMKDVIRQSVSKDSMQMIVFSCRGGDYTDIADKVFDLNRV